MFFLFTSPPLLLRWSSCSPQVIFVVQYFRKRPGVPQSPSDAGTANTEEAAAHVSQSLGAGDKFIVAQVRKVTCLFTL